MNKSKTIILLFLSVVLVTVTLALSSSFMINAQAQQSYNNNYYKSKDNTNVNVNKIKCINDNININGVNSGDVNVGNKGQVQQAGNSLGYYDETNTNNGYYEKGYNNKKDKDFDCLINNDNKNRQITITPLPTDNTETLRVIKNVDCQANSTICANNPISPSNFTIFI